MAQHINILHSIMPKYKKVGDSIHKTFLKGISYVRGSLKYQEITNLEFKESEHDLIFTTWYTIDRIRHTFEIHFDILQHKITKIYLVV